MPKQKVAVPLENRDWYTSLIEDVKSSIVEGEFTARWTLVEAYHLIGTRLLSETKNFAKAGLGGVDVCNTVARAIGKSPRTVYYAMAFAQKYPTLSDLPEGKNTSWHKICAELLSIPGTEEKFVCDICRKENWEHEQQGRTSARYTIKDPEHVERGTFNVHKACVWEMMNDRNK
jgi:hypothetical protein